jgi:predicted AAA+ superfamily ATPase
MIERSAYIQRLALYKDSNLIKVLTGIRRSGKSVILQLFRDYLLKNGVADAHILSINFEELENANLLDLHALNAYIAKKTRSKGKYYVFLDEVQNVPDFQRLADSLFVKNNIDLYLTGSNAKFLSSDLATLLSGRYIQIHILPLSFAEYSSAFSKLDHTTLYQNYVAYGSFPYAVELFTLNPNAVREYVRSILDTVIYKDVVARHGLRTEGILMDVMNFLMANIGNPVSAKKIADTLTSAGRPVSNVTIDKYLDALTASFVLYPAKRFDLKGKRILQTQTKYYLVDMGLRSLLSGKPMTDYGRILENLIFLELKRRHEDVWVGKTNGGEIDFVVKTESGGLAYYQVALSIRDEKTKRRELSALEAIKDNYPKFLLTLDFETNDHSGIRQFNAIDWLLGQVQQD